MVKKNSLVIGFLLVALLVGAIIGLSASKIFDRPITIVCAFSAGGGTDLVDRALAEGMKEYLGVQVNVVNMVGGLGGVATDYVWNKPRDGYHILGISETGLFLPANGGHHTTTKDWEYFMAGGSPGAVMVAADSPYKTFGDLLAACRAKPGQIKVAASVMGGLWSTKWAAICKTAGIKTNILGYNGSAPSITAAMAGEVDVVHVSAGEALSYLQAKKLRALCMSELEPFEIPGVGKVPAIVDWLPELKKILPMPQWLGLAVPADTPRPILNEITQAFKYAMNTKAVEEVLKSQLAVKYGYYGPKAKAVAQDLESKFCWLLWELGMAKRNPAELGIPKPEEM